MSKISKDDVLRVAALANLELTDAEVETFARQLDAILNYVEKLNELDTDNVEPMSEVAPPGEPSEPMSEPPRPGEIGRFARERGTPLREDVVVPCAIVSEVLAGAPDPDPPYFRVPKVIDR